MGNSHKLVQCQPTQNGIEWEVDLHDVEEDTLRTEVLRHPKCNWEGDTTTQHDSHRAHSRQLA
jgi:hypothetical protein